MPAAEHSVICSATSAATTPPTKTRNDLANGTVARVTKDRDDSSGGAATGVGCRLPRHRLRSARRPERGIRPAANSAEVSLRTVPEALVGATTRPGRWTQTAFDEHCTQLLTQTSAARLAVLGSSLFMLPCKQRFQGCDEILMDETE
jgi:hypothetical protein